MGAGNIEMRICTDPDDDFSVCQSTKRTTKNNNQRFPNSHNLPAGLRSLRRPIENLSASVGNIPGNPQCRTDFPQKGPAIGKWIRHRMDTRRIVPIHDCPWLTLRLQARARPGRHGVALVGRFNDVSIPAPAIVNTIAALHPQFNHRRPQTISAPMWRARDGREWFVR